MIINYKCYKVGDFSIIFDFFSFITLSTIGFGDKVPLKSFIEYNQGTVPMLRMIFTVGYIIFGKENYLRDYLFYNQNLNRWNDKGYLLQALP